MVSYPAAAIEIPQELYVLLGSDPKRWDPDAQMQVLLKYASIFLSRGRHTPGMTPLRQRYGHDNAFYFVAPEIVQYPNGVTERTRVCEVRFWSPHHYSEALVLTRDSDSRPLLLREIITYHPEPRIRENVPRSHVARQYVSNRCTIIRAHEWLLGQFAKGPAALVSILEDLAGIYSHHVEGERVELQQDERTLQQLSFSHAILKGMTS
ncbi:MAG TPA: hypothetical protein VGH44_00870 [Candidatus Saccharimonadia bacterium]|jgi:hypothetical protein